MPRHDVQCTHCSETFYDYTLSPWPDNPSCPSCGESLEILWKSLTPVTAAAHPSERTVVWTDPATGNVAYPPRNDSPMPDRYRKRGYVRTEFETAHSLEKFEKSHNVCCEKLWYNSGNEFA